VVILLNKPAQDAAEIPYPAQSSPQSRLNRLYGAFKETPIPDKSELRRQFHEKSAKQNSSKSTDLT
jgi:hypothetical protein